MIIPVEGKFYRAFVKGFEVILRAERPIGKKNHCVSCTCVDTRFSFTYVDGHEAIGNVSLDDIEEVVKTKDGWQSLA